ncbi:MAG: glycosyltransferase family 2 protein [Sulfurimonadaceae bacterium]
MNGIKINSQLPRVTVVTVTYNAEKFLERTIKSVIGQDYPDIEYIIIDGESTDNTIKIIKQYEENISYWISEPDNGIYDAMNKEINIATGEWINFMNAGDYFFNKSTILSIFKLLDKKSDLIYGDTIFINEKNLKEQLKKGKDISKFWKSLPFNHNSLFCKTQIAKNFPFDLKYQIVADSHFISQCISENKNFQYIPLTINYYLEGGYSDQNKRRRTLERWLLINNLNIIKDEKLDPFYYQRLQKDTQLTKEIIKKEKYDFNIKYSNIFEEIYKLEKLEQNYVIYGYGSIGKTIHKLIPNKIVDFVDIKLKNKHPLKLKNMIFDKIIISVLGREEQIIKYLTSELKISKENILILNIGKEL